MLVVEELVKSYNGATVQKAKAAEPNATMAQTLPFAVDHISITVEEGEFFTLLGPSGCGKTTTLRSIAGLERPDAGRIAVDGRVLFERAPDAARAGTLVPANKRGLGMVFQSYAIWPHLSVFDNAAFPLQVSKTKRFSRQQIAEKVERVLGVMELDKVAGRRATQLSGGQQQRLAMARALVVEPRLLLLDEPLSNLDAKLRESLRIELKRLQTDLGITTVYVTHDQDEALAMSSRIAVMNSGRIEQVGRPDEIYEAPASRFVAEFIGTSNFIDGRIGERLDDGWRIETPVGMLHSTVAGAEARAGSAVLVSLRPEVLTLDPIAGGPQLNSIRGTVQARSYLGEAIDHVVDVAGRTVRVRTVPSKALPVGAEAFVSVRPESVALVPR